MEIVTCSKFVRMSPRKLRLVAKNIRGQNPLRALDILSYTQKRAAKELARTLRQVICNARNNFQIAEEDLRIKRLEIGDGPAYKRFRAASRGMFNVIKRRTSHIKIVLETQGEGKKNGTKS